jgi:hypothetical protein
MTTAQEMERLARANEVLADALLSMLNIAGAAQSGSQLPAWKGLDVGYHCAKAHEALAIAGIK